MLASLAGAAGAAAFLLRAFRLNDTPPAVMLIMTAWVMAPFTVFFAATALSARWSVGTRRALDRAIAVASIAAVALYAINAAWPLSTRAAAVFVVAPPVSLALAASIVAIAALVRRQ